MVLTLLLSSCGEAERAQPLEGLHDPGSINTVKDEITFTDEPYDFTGPSSIAQLKALIPGNPVWYGLAKDDPYPVAGDCDPGAQHVNIPVNLDELPMTIEGVVTLHPRFFQKISVCGSDERYYGTYTLEDSTGGIMVLKDSRLGAFDLGDRVSLRVRGLLKYFDTRAVLVYDEEEIKTEATGRQAVSYQAVNRGFQDGDIGKVLRVRGRVSGAATNNNFNEMTLQSLENANVKWVVSLDRELGTRGVAPAQDSILEVTAVVLNSFGLRMIVGSLGQLEVIEP